MSPPRGRSVQEEECRKCWLHLVCKAFPPWASAPHLGRGLGVCMCEWGSPRSLLPGKGHALPCMYLKMGASRSSQMEPGKALLMQERGKEGHLPSISSPGGNLAHSGSEAGCITKGTRTHGLCSG